MIVPPTPEILTAQKNSHARCPFRLGCSDKQLSSLLLCIRIDPFGFLNNIYKMVKMIVKYEGALRCKVIHETTGNFFPTDAPLDNNGKGEVVSPTDLCAAALGSYMATIVSMQMEKLVLISKGCESKYENRCLNPNHAALLNSILRSGYL